MIEVISEQGLQGLTTREVAKRQGISESTIFKHYKTKNELILAVLEYFSQYDQAIFESLGLKEFKPIEAITYFVEAYVTYYENYPEITAITLSYEGLMREAELSDVVKRIFTKRVNTIQSLIEDAQRQKEIPKDVDTESLADLILGLEIVGEAANGAIGVEMYKELRPDVVTMDITMPEMSGLEALKAIKAFDPQAKVIMVSAMGQEGVVKESIINGAKTFIVKPFKEEFLYQTICKVLGI